MNGLRSLFYRTGYPSKIINKIYKMQIRSINSINQEQESDYFCQEKRLQNRNFLKGGIQERGHKEIGMAHVAWKFYEKLMFKKPEFSGLLVLLETARYDTNSADTSDFKKSYYIIDKSQMDAKSKKNPYGKQKTEQHFKLNCERMNNQEVLALLFHIILNNEGKTFEMWPENMKFLFNLLDVEVQHRIFDTFQLEYHETKDALEFIETALHLMLATEVGQFSFYTYIIYCYYRFDSAISTENISLLLLCILKMYSGPYSLFSLIEHFTLQNFNHFDLMTLELLCSTFFICHKRFLSGQLLDQIGMKLLHQLKLEGSKLDTFGMPNIFKALSFSGYAKVSFYRDLEFSLIADNFLESCNTVEIKYILESYGRMRMFPSVLIKRLVAQCKKLLETGKNPKQIWAKHIG